jgi:acyl-CoA thioesterase
MTQRGEPVLEAIAWFVADLTGLAHDVARMPAVHGPGELPAIETLLPPEERALYPFWDNLEHRPLDWVPPAERRPGEPAVRGWYRFRPRATFDDPCVDAARTLVLVDTMLWPAAWRAYLDPTYQAPSLDVAVRFHRDAAAADWLLVDAVAPVAADGLIGGEARVWSAEGRLLASGGGQLLCRPPTP